MKRVLKRTEAETHGGGVESELRVSQSETMVAMPEWRKKTKKEVKIETLQLFRRFLSTLM